MLDRLRGEEQEEGILSDMTRQNSTDDAPG